MTERKKYIDVSKGILISCVVLGHIASVCREYGGIGNLYMNHTGWLLAMFYTPFYMQAFFFITGFTSNFDKPFNEFFLQNVKRILCPYICFGIWYAAFNNAFFGYDFFFSTLDGERIFFLVEYYWFLSSLFIAKLLYWVLNKISSNWLLLLLIGIVLLLLSIWISQYYSRVNGTAHWHNYFHYRNALMMIVFVGFGAIFKRFSSNVQTKILPIGGGIYLFLFGVSLVLSLHIPTNGHGAALLMQDVPMHLICSISGSLLILFVAKRLEKCRFLETIGRYSLTVYTTHYLVLEALAVCIGGVCQPVGKVAGVALYIFVAGTSLLFCYFAVFLFNKKPFSYMLGDF